MGCATRCAKWTRAFCDACDNRIDHCRGLAAAQPFCFGAGAAKALLNLYDAILMQAVGILVANGKAPKRRKKGGEENEGKSPRCFVPVRAVFPVRGGGNGDGGLYSRVEPIFADAFFEEVGNVLFSQSSAVAGNRVASLKMNGDVYVYDAATEEYSLLCSVSVVPKGQCAI